ncbi:hypothetical protein GCM10027282_07050 [Frigoribacterium salinisoli]
MLDPTAVRLTGQDELTQARDEGRVAEAEDDGEDEHRPGGDAELTCGAAEVHVVLLFVRCAGGAGGWGAVPGAQEGGVRFRGLRSRAGG